MEALHFINEEALGLKSGRKAMEIPGGILKQPLQSKHTVLTQSECLLCQVGARSWGEDSGRG